MFSNPSRALLGKQFIIVLCCIWGISNNVSASNLLPSESYQVTKVATELNSPWSMVELPNGTWIVTERDGHVVIIKGSKQTRIKLPLVNLYVAGQGGLLDVVLAPDFAQSKQVFFTYAQGELEANRLLVVSATFDGQSFSNLTTVYKVQTDKGTPQHYAGRLLVLPDNSLLLTSGDGFDYREQAQVLTSQLGKILRFNMNGSIPSDNPFVNHSQDSAKVVFSLGHRNPQGLVYDYDRQQIIGHEHGPAGGDELNIINAGKNYGWPVITFGRDYSRARISPFIEYKGMLKPNVDWTPSIAPSGMAYYGTHQKAFPSLHQHVLVTTLVDKKVYAINVADGQFTQSHILPEVSGRLRDVLVTKDGEIAILSDGQQAQLMLVSAVPK